ncbi:MAG: response regulator transcription factor [Pseudomonadota bacterium]
MGPVHSGEVAADLSELDSETVVLLHAADRSSDASLALEHFQTSGARPRVIVLCATEALSRLVRELGSRVAAIIPDNYPAETLTSAIRLVALGFRIFHERDAGEVRQSMGTVPYQTATRRDTQQSVDAYSLLTKREVAILARLRAGLENKSIAQELGVSEATVKVHLRAIYRKTGVRNRTQAALWGSDHL